MSNAETVRGLVDGAQKTFIARTIAETHYKNAIEAQALALQRRLAEIGAALPTTDPIQTGTIGSPEYRRFFDMTNTFLPETGVLQEDIYEVGTRIRIDFPKILSPNDNPEEYLDAASRILATIQERLKDNAHPTS